MLLMTKIRLLFRTALVVDCPVQHSAMHQSQGCRQLFVFKPQSSTAFKFCSFCDVLHLKDFEDSHVNSNQNLTFFFIYLKDKLLKI